MEIADIKQQLTLKEVLNYYGLKPDKHQRLHCPFHDDKTPSLQVYYKTNTVYCFSSNCQTHGKSLDVIDFIKYKEGLTKHAAIQKAKEMISGATTPIKPPTEELARIAVLTKMFTYFKKATYNSQPAKGYLKNRHLEGLIGSPSYGVGYNSGQFHHGARKSQHLIESCLQVGLLIDKNLVAKTGEKAYKVFGKNGIVFPLRNQQGQIVSLYFRNIQEKDHRNRHFYLKDRQGLYPHYPKPSTTKLLLTEAIIDAATLLQLGAGSGNSDKQSAIGKEESISDIEVLALYGTNGLTEEHMAAIKQWVEVEPERRNPDKRSAIGKEIIFWFDADESGWAATKKYSTLLNQTLKVHLSVVEMPKGEDINSLLDGHTPALLHELLHKRRPITSNGEVFPFSTEKNTTEPTENKLSKAKSRDIEKPEAEKDQSALAFLQSSNVLNRLNEKIGACGIVGENQSRLLLFLLALSYRNKRPLHGIVQGSSGSGKTHIISRIADLMPQEDVLRFTRITENSLYNWGEYDLVKKVIVIEDLDGLKEDALYALREFISNQVLRSSVTIKDKKGNNKSRKKEVKGQFSSLSATTKGETYEDNMNRSFLIAVDESKAQTNRIIHYQNCLAAGMVKDSEEEDNVGFIREVVRQLKSYDVINPYAPYLLLPDKVQQVRRLNEMFQSVIKQVTLVNQYQREVRSEKLYTELEDIEQASILLFESIVLKVDELDGSHRSFYQMLKHHFNDKEFTRFQAMDATGFKRTQLQQYLNELLRFEYIKQKGFANRGFKYRVNIMENIESLRTELKAHFSKQLDHLRNINPTASGSQTVARRQPN